MDFDSLGWMKDIDLAEYLGINMHTVTFDDSKWKVDELLDDLDKWFTGIKWTKSRKVDIKL